VPEEIDPPPRKFELAEKPFERVNVTVRESGKSAEHDVHAILQHNLSVQQQAGLNEVEFRPRNSHRRRDYLFLLIAGNLLITGIVAVGKFNPIIVIFGTSAAFVFVLILTWIMWVVMDDY